MPDDDYIFFTERRPRCLSCGSAELHAYKSMPAEEDGTRMRYVVCRECAARWKLVIEPERFQSLETSKSPKGQ